MTYHSKKSFLFFLLMIFSFLSVSATQTLNLVHFSSEVSQETHSLLSLQDQIVQARGFWYPLSADQGILSADSGLKSCCLKAPDKLQQQLLVKGQLLSLPAQRVITLEGIFKIDPIYNQDGQLIQFYVLEQAREVHQSTSYALLLILGFLLSLLFVWQFFLKRRQSR